MCPLWAAPALSFRHPAQDTPCPSREPAASSGLLGVLFVTLCQALWWNLDVRVRAKALEADVLLPYRGVKM